MKIKNTLIYLLLGINIIVQHTYTMEDTATNSSQILEITKRNNQALFQAIKNGDKQEVERLLKEEHIDINTHEEISGIGFTPLIYTIRKCNFLCDSNKWQSYLEIIRMLLNTGADVNKKERSLSQNTPLMYTTLGGHIEIATILLKSNANPNVKNYIGKTALMIAASKPNALEMAKTLLMFGANPNIQDKFGKTALDIAQSCKTLDMITLLTAAQEKRKTDSVVTLLLHEWVQEESLWHNLDLFLMKKILKYVKHIRNNEALLKAVKSGNNYWIEQLLKEPNIDVNIKDENGDTALNLAIIQNKPRLLSLVKMLLEVGADREIQNNNEQTALDLAGIFNNDRVKNLLKDEEDTCDICCISIDDKEEGFEPSCGHNAFHSACIEQWKNSGPNKTCPICRGSLPLTKKRNSDARGSYASMWQGWAIGGINL